LSLGLGALLQNKRQFAYTLAVEPELRVGAKTILNGWSQKLSNGVTGVRHLGSGSTDTVIEASDLYN